MPLQSNLFAGDSRLEACAVSNPDHVTPGATGPFVQKIQGAVMALDRASIDPAELASGRYGPGTAAAVLAYKTARSIINRAYQTQADDIVGIMTITTMDAELIASQVVIKPTSSASCPRLCACRPRPDFGYVAQLVNASPSTGARAPDGVAASPHAGRIAHVLRASQPTQGWSNPVTVTMPGGPTATA